MMMLFLLPFACLLPFNAGGRIGEGSHQPLMSTLNSFPRGSSSRTAADNPSHHSTSTTTSPVTLGGRYYDPIRLEPSYAIAQGRRVVRQVRCREGSLHRRLVLQPVDGVSPRCCYGFDRQLTEQPNKGVTLFLATPMVPEAIGSPYLIRSGRTVVIKVVPHPNTNRRARPLADNPLAEIAAFQCLMRQDPHHPNVIHLLDCMQDDHFVYLVLPYLAGGDLYSRVAACSERGLPEEEARSYFRQIAQGLLVMKHSGLAHRDVSLENIMLSHRRATDDEEDQESTATTIRLIDLGMCLRVPSYACSSSSSSSDVDDPPFLLNPQHCYGKPG